MIVPQREKIIKVYHFSLNVFIPVPNTLSIELTVSSFSDKILAGINLTPFSTGTTNDFTKLTLLIREEILTVKLTFGPLLAISSPPNPCLRFKSKPFEGPI